MSVMLFTIGVILLVVAAVLAVHASQKELRRGRMSYTWLQILLVMVLALIGVLLLCFNWGVVSGPDIHDRTTRSGPAGGIAGNNSQEIRRRYFVDFNAITTARCAKLVQKYFPSGMPLPATASSTGIQVVDVSHGAIREQKGAYPDSVNVPLRPPVIEAEQATTCFDPVQAAMNMNGLGQANIGGVTLAAINPWMQQTQGNPATAIADWVQRCLTNDSTVRGDCAKKMAATAELISRFTVNGIVRATSLWNYHCRYACVPNGGTVPVLELNPNQEYHANFLVVSLPLSANDCIVRFGWNVGLPTTDDGGDQRLAGLSCTPLASVETPPVAAPSRVQKGFL